MKACLHDEIKLISDFLLLYTLKLFSHKLHELKSQRDERKNSVCLDEGVNAWNKFQFESRRDEIIIEKNSQELL